MNPFMEFHESSTEAVRAGIAAVSLFGDTYVSGPDSMNAGKSIRELLGYQFCITDPRQRIFVSADSEQPFRIGLAVSRFFYMLSGSNRLEPIEFYTDGVRRFSDDDITLAGSSYGNRIFGDGSSGGQFQAVVDLILRRPNTKRSTIAIYQPHDAGRESKDVPCASMLYFRPQDGVLNMTLAMRANDVAKLCSYNVFEFSLLMECMAAATGMQLGNYYHWANSLHLRGADIGQVAEFLVKLDPQQLTSPMLPISTFSNDLRMKLVETELGIRTLFGPSNIAQAESYWEQLEYEDVWKDLLGVIILEVLRRKHTPLDEIQALRQRMLVALPQGVALQAY